MLSQLATANRLSFHMLTAGNGLCLTRSLMNTLFFSVRDMALCEEWELVKEKRTRYSKEVREKSMAKYIGMYLLDEDDEDHEKRVRVIKRMMWHKDRRATAAGWTPSTRSMPIPRIIGQPIMS